MTYYEWGEAYVAYRPVGDCEEYGGWWDSWTYASANINNYYAGPGYKHQIHYYADMVDLKEFCEYEYQVGRYIFWSEKFKFITRTRAEEGSELVRAVIFGDFGSTNYTDSLNLLVKEYNQTDLILHMGDLAYDLHTNYATIGDQYMNEI